MDLVEEFLEKLPEGAASYDGARVRAGVVHAWVEGHDPDELARRLERYPEAAAVLEQPGSAWVREVHATIVYLAVRELFFGSDGAYVAAAFGKNVEVLSRPVLAPLIRLGQDRLIRWVPKVFEQFHRGTTVTVSGEGPDLRLVYRYPPHLIPALIARCHVTAIAALLDRVGRSAVLELESHGAEETAFNVVLAD